MVFKTVYRKAGHKYCRMPQREHSAILSIFNKLSFVIKIFVFSISEWPFDTGSTVQALVNRYEPLSNVFSS